MHARTACVASTSGPSPPPRGRRHPRRTPGGGGTGPASPSPPVSAAAPSPSRSPESAPKQQSPLPPGGGSVADRVAAAREGVRRSTSSRGPAPPGAAAGDAGSPHQQPSAAGRTPRPAHSVEGCATEFVAETLLPTRQGKFRLRGYRHTADGGLTHTEPCAILTGRPEGRTAVPLRVHDACFTSEVLGSLKCDCADQLRLALDYISGPEGPGLVIYLQQEGRGIGLANKIAAYALQEGGLDTVDANRALGLPDDAREYSSVASILADLGIASVRLMTNNPRKVELLRGLGVAVVGRIPCLVQAQEHSVGYLLAKAGRMSHLLAAAEGGGGGGGGGGGPAASDASSPSGSAIPSLSPLASADEEPALDGSFCYWDHGGEPLAPSAGDGTGGGEPEPPATPPPQQPGRMGRVSGLGQRLVSLEGGE